MKKYLIILLLVFFILPGVISAQTSLPDASLLPDSSFYFLKSWKESIQLFFTFNAENKAKQYLHLAEVRLAEYQKMLEKGKIDIAEKTLSKYENQLNRALSKAEEIKQKGNDIKNLTQQIETSTSKHLEVLKESLQKVPETARKGIETAIENSQKGIERVLKREGDKTETKSEEKIESEKSDIKDETSNWKTYRNEKYGFEFRYPTLAKLSSFHADGDILDHIQIEFEEESSFYNTASIAILIYKKGIFNLDKIYPPKDAEKCRLYQRTTQLINKKEVDVINIGHCPPTVGFGPFEYEYKTSVVAFSNNADLVYSPSINNNFIRDNNLDEIIFSTLKFIK